MKRLKNAKGITLIALVITIIVLLILAGITLSTLAGRRGIIRQAQNAETEHNKESAREDIILVTYQSLDNKGYTDTAKLEQGLNDIGATIIEKGEELWKVEHKGYEFVIDIEEGDVSENNGSYGGIYSEPGLEGKIAPTDLFEYVIINEGTTASLATNSLPEKEAKIVRINPKYCNKDMYDPFIVGNSEIAIDTNYGINYEGEIISDILVIPYQVELEGELYKITSVDLRIYSSESTARAFPNVNTIIYPNTVKEVFGAVNSDLGYNLLLEKVVLPKDLPTIPSGMFSTCESIEEITIPSNVTKIPANAFSYCIKLDNVVIPDGVLSIGYEAFYNCESLTTITIPKSVTNIERGAFYHCDLLTTVNYEGSEEEWDNIVIGLDNDDLTSATINYNYKI